MTVTLWHASGVEVPARLVSALTGRGLRVNRVGDPFHALAEICKASRGRRAPDAGTRLVIVFPELLTDAPELCAAAANYAPSVPRWQFGPATQPTLRPIAESDVESWRLRHQPQPKVVVVPEAVRPPTPTSRTYTQPQLRLAGEGPGPEKLQNQGNSADADNAAAESTGTTRTPLITDEELRMLLGEHNEGDHP